MKNWLGGLMTEKRFSVKKSGNGLFYRDGDYEIDNTIQFIIETVEMKLNQLSDENEQLRKENDMFSCELSVSANKEISRNCRIAELEEENEQLKKELKSIEDSFKFSCTENHIEFNKDKLKVEDTHTELTLKDGKLYISVFIPQLNEYVKFFYWVTGRKMEREFINYDGDVE